MSLPILRNKEHTERYFRIASAALIMICVYIFLVIERPWESIRFLEGIPIERVFGILMIIVAILSGRFRVVSSPTNKWVYGLLGLHFLLSPFAFNQGFAFDQAIEYTKMVILYLLMLSVADDERSLKVLIKAYVFSTMLYAGHSLWEYSNGRHWWRMGMVRMIGVDAFLNDPNAFGASVVLSFPFVYALLRTETAKTVRMLYYGYFALGLVCVVLTGSRSAFVGLLFLLFLWGVSRKGGKKLALVGIIILVIGVGWNFIPDDKQERIRSLWDEDAGPASAHVSAEGRILGWKASWKMFKGEPLTGVGGGLRNFVDYRMAYHIDGWGEESRNQAHILYGEILAEHGIFGAILFIGLVISIGKSAIIVRRSRIEKEGEEQISFFLSEAIIASLLLLLFLGLGGHNFYRPLWLWLAAWSGSLLKFGEQQRNLDGHGGLCGSE